MVDKTISYFCSVVATATKDEDELGVATPDLVIQGGDPLVVYGEGFMGQYSPLSRANLEEKLEMEYVLIKTNTMYCYQKVQNSVLFINISCSGLTIEFLFTRYII